MDPAYEPERAKIQGELDSIPEGETYSLFHREYPGPLAIRRPITIDGRNATIWSTRGPVLQILSDGVVLKNLKVEVTREDATGGEEGCAIHVTPGCDVHLENVIVHGMVVGVAGEEGAWSCPKSVYLGQVAHGEEHRFIIRMAIPVACRLKSDIQGIDTRPHTLAPGYHDIELILEKGVSKDTLICGTLSIATACLTRHITLNGFVRVPDPEVGECVHGRGQVVWEPADWAALIAAAKTTPTPPPVVPLTKPNVPVLPSGPVQPPIPPVPAAPVVQPPSPPPERPSSPPVDTTVPTPDSIPQTLPSPPAIDPADLIPRRVPRKIISTPMNPLFIQNIKTQPVAETPPDETAPPEKEAPLSNVFTKPASKGPAEQEAPTAPKGSPEPTPRETRRLPIYILLDCSDAIAGEPLDALEQGLKALLADLRSDPQALETVQVSLITFGDTPRLDVPLRDISTFQTPALRPMGRRNLGKALSLLANRIELEVRKPTPQHKGDWIPLVLLFLSGTPTDPWTTQAVALSENPNIRVFAFAMGQARNESLLHVMSRGNVFFMTDLQPERVKEIYGWHSQQVKVESPPAQPSTPVSTHSGVPPSPVIPKRVKSSPVSQIFQKAKEPREPAPPGSAQETAESPASPAAVPLKSDSQAETPPSPPTTRKRMVKPDGVSSVFDGRKDGSGDKNV